ncbi:IS3 family transposase [bacterium]|nr:IS3 family transposase [bacterium]
MCQYLGVTRQAYYKRLHKQLRDGLNQELVKVMIQEIRQHMPRIGGRKLHYLLNRRFKDQSMHSIGRDKLFALLREEGMLVLKKRKYTKTTYSKHWMRTYPNLAALMRLDAPEQLWVADITYVALAQGYLYLHLITDAYSKKIMGYVLSPELSANISLRALKMALANRYYSHQLTHHSDRGLQYCSGLYTDYLRNHHVQISMTEHGDPYENAIAERVNGILKDEFGLGDTLESFTQANKLVHDSIQIYNHQRPHWSCGLLTPCERHLQKTKKPPK